MQATLTALVVLPASVPVTPVFAQVLATEAERQGQFALLMGFWLVLLAFALVILFIPAFIAFHRQHPNKWAIAIICLAFGGTVIGWFGALIWALHAVHESPDGSRGGESGLNIFANDPVRVRVEPHAQPAPREPVEDVLTTRLSRLKRLADEGMITVEEHAALRKQAIDTALGSPSS